MISLFLRCNGPIELAVKQLEGIGSSLSVPSADGQVTSLADGLSKALNKYLKAKAKFGLKALLLGEVEMGQLDEIHEEQRKTNGGKRAVAQTAFKVKCPECRGNLVFEEGCVKCPGCGYAQC